MPSIRACTNCAMAVNGPLPQSRPAFVTWLMLFICSRPIEIVLYQFPIECEEKCFFLSSFSLWVPPHLNTLVDTYRIQLFTRITENVCCETVSITSEKIKISECDRCFKIMWNIISGFSTCFKESLYFSWRFINFATWFECFCSFLLGNLNDGMGKLVLFKTCHLTGLYKYFHIYDYKAKITMC